MTKQEQAALEELHLTPEQFEAKQAKVAQLLNSSDKLGEQPAWMAKAKAETIALDTPEQAEFRKSKLQGQLEESVLLADGIRPANAFPVTLKMRKKRSDAGKPKQKAPAIAQKPGVLSSEQAARLRDLIDTRETRRIELETAKDHLANREGAVDAAEAELEAYILELQGKGSNGTAGKDQRF